MTLADFTTEIYSKPMETYIVALKYKYDFEKEYTIENQVLDVEENRFIWLEDWDEGQIDVEVLGYIPLREVQVAPMLFIARDIDADKLEKLFVENPPMIQVVPKTGHWINIDKTHSKCDRCGGIFEIASANGEANYCPNCGARMESEE